MELEYLVKAKKSITDRGKRRSGNKLETVLPKFAYLKDISIPKEIGLKKKKRIIRKELNRQEIKLNPFKFELEKKEELMVQPNPIIGPRNRRMMQSSIFEDTWAEIKIPEKAYRRWYSKNKDKRGTQ